MRAQFPERNRAWAHTVCPVSTVIPCPDSGGVRMQFAQQRREPGYLVGLGLDEVLGDHRGVNCWAVRGVQVTIAPLITVPGRVCLICAAVLAPRRCRSGVPGLSGG